MNDRYQDPVANTLLRMSRMRDSLVEDLSFSVLMNRNTLPSKAGIKLVQCLHHLVPSSDHVFAVAYP